MATMRGKKDVEVTHEPATAPPTPDPSQEGNNPPCVAPLLGGARGGFRGAIRVLEFVDSLPTTQEWGEDRGEGCSSLERPTHLLTPAPLPFS